MSKHTPTPWHVKGDEDYCNKYSIVPDFYDGKSPKELGKEDDANIAFIERAVNSHDALLDACKFALGEMEHLEQFDNLSYFYTDRIKAAIKLAEEGKL